MNNDNLKTIDLSKVNSLETYIFQLALLCASVQTLYALQAKAESIGIFDVDETEASKTVKYQAARLFQAVDDLLRMCTARTGMDWDQMLIKVLEKAKDALQPIAIPQELSKKTRAKRTKK